MFYDNSTNENLKLTKSFQTFLGCVFFKGKIFMVFEHFQHSMSDILYNLKRKEISIEENILMKILKYSMEAFLSCKESNMYYPEFCLENLFVNEPNLISNSEETLNINNNSEIREVKLMHPFLVKSFFVQIEVKNCQDVSNLKKCI